MTLPLRAKHALGQHFLRDESLLERMLDDPSARARMGVAGRQRLRLFCADDVLPRIERAYSDALRDTTDSPTQVPTTAR